MKPTAIDILGPASSWRVTHSTDLIGSPGNLSASSFDLWRQVHCRLGDTGDQLAIARRVRCSRKANALVVSAEGYLPFGTQPTFRHVCRYTDGLARVTTDLTIPRQTGVKGSVEIGSLELGNGWTAYRSVGTADADWHPLQSTMTWDSPPPAIELRHQSGWLVEIGTGTDLWRWRDGLDGLTPACQLALVPAPAGGWLLQRTVSSSTERAEPRPRTYRFTWYAAWGREVAPGSPRPRQAAVWTRDGALDPSRMAAIDAGTDLQLNLADANWPDACRRTTDRAPCFVSHTVNRRLRHVFRQLQSHPDQDVGVLLSGFRSDICHEGSHLDRPRDLPHWDHAALLDTLTWARHILGPQRRLLLDPNDAPTLSLRQACSPAAIEAEFAGLPD